MHVYVYDDFIVGKKYENLLARIETRITDLGLNGKIIRLGAMKNTPVLVENEIKNGAKTIIAVGNNKTINKILNTIIKNEESLPGQAPVLGIIPIGKKHNSIAAALGIHDEEEACDVLSARRVEKVSIGLAQSTNSNNQTSKKHFLASADIFGKDTTVEIDENLSIELSGLSETHVINLDTYNLLPDNIANNPQDKTLELFIRKQEANGFFKKSSTSSESLFSFKKLTILNKNFPVILDEFVEVTPPVEINIFKNKLSVIVGKERKF